MRTEINPEKLKIKYNIEKQHRVVVVVHIPNIVEDYYKESLEILDLCLKSLVSSINLITTNITILNNNSVSEVDSIVKKYICSGSIDKYVIYSENKGKVYAVINEVRGVFEPFVTITDCDVLFFDGWEQAVFEIFQSFPNAGVVTPLPSQHCALHSNVSLFFNHFLFGQIKYDKIVNDEDTDLYIQGVNNTALINKKGKYNWKQKQYYLKGKVKAIVGATHFVATYKSDIFKTETTFPKIKFLSGYETEFIDELADKKGLYRLSTLKTYAYHIGNSIDEFVLNKKFNYNSFLDKEIFTNIKLNRRAIVPLWIKSSFFRIIKKLFKL